MHKRNRFILLLISLLLMLSLAGCGNHDFAETGTEIISADEVADFIGQEDVVIVDVRSNEDFLQQGHLANAVNIPREAITIQEPYANMLAPADQIETVMQQSGIGNEDWILVYDNNANMDAARFWWTMKVYGHEHVQVISGGFDALTREGLANEKEATKSAPSQYKVTGTNQELIADLSAIKSQLNDPQGNVILLDTRTQEEYDAGTIPTSILMDYAMNNYADGTYRNVQDLQIMYLEAGIDPSDTIILYCKTSIRGAQAFLALYNAGFQNLKLYDGAWLEYSSYESLPVQLPGNAPVAPTAQDQS